MSKITHLRELNGTAIAHHAARVNPDVARRIGPSSRTAREVFADARRLIAGEDTSSGILDMLGIRRTRIEHGRLVDMFKEIARELPYTTQHERSIMVAWLGTRAHVLAEKIFRGRNVPREAVVDELRHIEAEYYTFYNQINRRYGARPAMEHTRALQGTTRWVSSELDREAGAVIRRGLNPEHELGEVAVAAAADTQILQLTKTKEAGATPVGTEDEGAGVEMRGTVAADAHGQVVEVDPKTVEEIEEALGNATSEEMASDDPRGLLRV